MQCLCGAFLWVLALGRKFLREPPGGPEGVRSTERSEPRKVATRSVAKGHALSKY